jgi:peroxiredoxin
MKTLEEKGIAVVAVSYDSTDVLAKFADKQKVTFPLLSDPDSKVVDGFELRNKEMQGKKYGDISLEGIPYPGTFLLDKDGVVRGKLFLDGYKDRHTTDALIEAVEKLKKK